MVTKKEVESKLSYLLNLRSIFETYEEIAATRMGRIRSSVLKSRDFLLELNTVFQQVKSSYQEEVNLLMKKKRIKDLKQLTFLNRNGKTLYVLVSANTGLYGEIIKKTYDIFIENVKKEKADVAIIGRLGQDLFREEKIDAPLTYFDLPDDTINKEQLKKIVAHIIQYQKILVFYEQFNNVVNQKPIITNISGDPMSYDKAGPAVKYLFEPTLEQVMAFFEKEITASIFEQIVLESELAKFASRMVVLDAAAQNTRDNVKLVSFEKERIRHRDANRKQIEKFSSMALWK